jgi:hypothetical protein
MDRMDWTGVQVTLWQLSREKSLIAKRYEMKGNSGHTSKANFGSDICEFESSRPSGPMRSPLCDFRVCENRRHSRGLGWRAVVSGWQILEFRLWTGGFAAAVSARHFPISVSAPVRYVTETDLRSRFTRLTAAKVERWIDCPVRGKARRRRSWPAEPRIAYHARRRHEICGFEILLTVRCSECEPNQRAFNETLRVPLALSGHC